MITAALGSNQVIGIGLNIYAVNNFSGPAAQAGLSLTKLQNEFRRTMYENLRVARNVFTGLALAGGFVSRAMFQNYKTFANFEYMMKGTQIAAGATENQYKSMSVEALKMGETTMFTADKIANSMREIAKAGMDYNQIMNITKASVAGAGASMEDLDTVSNVLISTMNQFQIPGKNAMYVMDQLTEAALGSKSNIQQLGEALKLSAADMSSMNIPLSESLGMLMTLHNYGLEASLAGTALSNSWRYFVKSLSPEFQTGRQKKAFAMLGLSTQDFTNAQGGIIDTMSAIRLLGAALKGKGDIEKHGILSGLFEVRGKRGMIPLINDMENLEVNIKKVAGSSGLAESNLKKMMDTSQGELYKLNAAWYTFKASFGAALKPLFSTLTLALTGIVKALSWIFNSGGFFGKIIPYLVSWGAGLLIIKTLSWTLKGIYAGYAMLFTSDRISFQNMKEAMATGWAQLIAVATAYQGVINGIAVTQNGMAGMGIYNTKGRAMMGGIPVGTKYQAGPQGQGGVFYTSKNKYGNISNRWAQGYKDKAGIYGDKDKYYRKGSFAPDIYGVARTSGGMKVGRTPVSNIPPKTGVLKGFGKFGSVLGTIGGILGGPWGLAAMIALPPAISWLTNKLGDNTDAIEANTESNKLKGKIEHYKNYDPNIFSMQNVLDLVKELDKNKQSSTSTSMAGSKSATIIINTDGEQTLIKKFNLDQSRKTAIRTSVPGLSSH